MANKKNVPARAYSLDDLISEGIRYQEPGPVPDVAAAPPERTAFDTAKDAGISLVKGAISVPEAAVGLLDIPTGGRVGKALESIGFRPKEAKAMLDEQYSEPQKRAFQAVQDAQGFGGKLMAALESPSVIGHTVAESLPAMGAGGVVGRGVLAAAPRLGTVGAAAAGEGVFGAGSAAEQIRQEMPDGTMGAPQTAAALATGAGTAAFGALGNKIAKSLGIADVDTLLLGAARSPVASKGVVRRVLEGAASEGILEELPQSIQEQVLQNAATGKDLAEGVDQAAVLGMLSGAAMGGGANALGSGSARAADAPAVPPPDDSLFQPPPSAAAPLALPAPTITVGGDGTARTADQRMAQPAGEPFTDVTPIPAGTDEGAGSTVPMTGTDLAGGDAIDVPARVVPERGALSRAANAVVAEPPETGALSRAAGQVEAAPVRGAESASGIETEASDAGARDQAAVDAISQGISGPGGAVFSDEAPSPANGRDAPGAVETSGARPAVAGADALPGQPAAVGAAEGVFPTYEAADAYRREQMHRGGSVRALPVAAPGGGFALAARGTPQYAEGERLRDERRAAGEREAAGIREGDILNRLGQPFTVRLPAIKAAKQAGDGHEVVPVQGGFVVRRAPQGTPQQGTQIAAEILSNRGADSTRTEQHDGENAAQRAGIQDPAARGEAAETTRGDGALPARGLPAAGTADLEADGLAGAPIDQEWTAFSPSSGTLAIPRAEMPQVKAEHRGAMVNFLKARGVDAKVEEVSAGSLKPTQAEFSSAKVEKARNFTGGDRAILVSSDGHVVDGHHQWMAAREAGSPLRVIRLDAPVRELLPLVHEFPSSTASAGAGEMSAPEAPAERWERMPRAERLALTAQAGLHERVAGQHFGDLIGTIRKRLAAAMEAPVFSRSAMKSVDANVARGKEALARALTLKTTVHRAMFRSGLGWVDFVWGSEGIVKPNGRTKRGMGLSHILEARQRKDGMNEAGVLRLLDHIVQTIAKGAETSRKELGGTIAVKIENGGHRVALAKNPGSNAWVVTGFGVEQVHERPAMMRTHLRNPSLHSPETNWGLTPWPPGDTVPSLDRATHRDSTKRGSPAGAGDSQSLAAARDSGNPDGHALQKRGLSVEELRREVRSLTADWKNAPRVIVAQNLDDPAVPDAVREERDRRQSLDTAGEPRGVFYNGTVYLLADELPTRAHAAITLFHEALGHAGLRGVFGDALTPILEQLAQLRRPEIAEKAAEYNLDPTKREDRLIAAEEVLAEWAQRRPEIGYVRRAIAAIRQWLRQNIPGMQNLRLKDDEIIGNYLMPARGWVERGHRTTAEGATAFSLTPGWRGAVNFAEAREAAKKLQGMPLTNRATGMVASISRDDLDKMLSGKAAGKSVSGRAHAFAVANVDHLFEMAELGETHADRKGAGLKALHRFFAPMNFNGQRLDVKLTVKEYHDPKQRKKIYTVEAMDVLPIQKESASASVEPETSRGGVGMAQVKTAEPSPPGGGTATSVSNAENEGNAWDGKKLWSRVPVPAEGAGAPASSAVPAPQNAGGQATVDISSQSDFSVPKQENPGNDKPVFSRTNDVGLNDVQDYRAQADRAMRDLFQAPGTVGWWHKTVGSMHNLARRSPEFRRVFDAAQNFLGDVSAYATRSADLAPRLLPKLETWRDVLPGVLGGTAKPVSATDTRAIAAPIFEGTLSWGRDASGRAVPMADLEARYAQYGTDQKARMLLRGDHISEGQLRSWQALPEASYERAVRNAFEREFLRAGVVWSDAELRSQFRLSAGQIGLYREFRTATDQSLSDLAVSDMLRLAGEDGAGARERALAARDADAAAAILRDHLLARAEEQPKRREVLIDTANRMIDKAQQARGLMKRGYAPLSRFGHYTVDVLDEQGGRAFFGMFETKAEANRMARRMRENYPRGTIRQGTVSEQAYRMFSGVTPETLELFGEMVGLESDGTDPQHQLFQQYLKLAKANRSAMKRLIERKGIAGFSEDAGRVLAGFVYSNARLTSSNLHAGDLTQATAAIPKEQGELKDIAIKLADYVRNPQEEGQAVRGLLFAQYLGGSLASAMVNTTQPIAVTMPYLSQWGGAAKAAGRMRAALVDVWKKDTGDTRLDAALKQAADEGIVAPQEVHQLMAQAQGRGSLRAGDGTVAGDLRAKAGNFMSKASLAWGKPFAAAEQFNRRVTFIAAWRTAVAEGIADPARFAEEAIRETQFVYNKGNKPQWARGAVGGTLFTFKQYSVSYLELLHRMYQAGPEGKKAALFALAMLFLMGGSGGLPFMEDAEDLIDGALQRMGYSFSTKQARRQFLIDTLGAGGAEFVESGISGLPGVPIDVSGRLGLGNLLPGTGLLTKKADYGRDVAEILGPAGDLVKRGFQGAGQILSGSVTDGLLTMSPTAIRNAEKGRDMFMTGMYKDQRGRKVVDADGYDAFVKAIGFQPAGVARAQEANAARIGMKNQNVMMRSELIEDMAMAIYEKDAGAQQAIRDRMRRWNERNPSSPVTINMLAVRKRLIDMRLTKAQRIEKSTPRAIRAEVRKAVAAMAD